MIGACATRACVRTAHWGDRPPAPETFVFPGFSLADYAPSASTPEVTLAPM